MPTLTLDEIQRFKELIKQTKGVDLTDAEAENQGSRLIRLSELLIEVDRNKRGIIQQPDSEITGNSTE
jgi:hypothetical protein